jgi:hypothetical protein
MHEYDFDSHDEFRQHDELDRFSHQEYPRPFDEYPPHHEYRPTHEDYRRQPHDTYPRPHDYPPPRDEYPRPTHGDEFDRHRHSPSHSNDRFDDEDFRPQDDGAARKPGNKLELPDTKSVDLASVQFPHRREEFSLPDGPALNAVHVNRRDEDPSPIGARDSKGFALPESKMNVANIAARKRDDLDLGDMAKSGAVQGVL